VSKLPQVSGVEVAKVLRQVGYEHDHTRGSHMVMREIAAPHRRVTVPQHNPVAKGTLRAIIRAIGLTVDEFVERL